ncbi:MAG: type II secretion system inner membrane protein GspF [Deltaproteobacteria bacterium]|nr:type II secretion system inner membrane protein GspF [Deltaproteobacteria bacterium]MCL5792791.1 type II secretion system inner membrane protein GspF [Deltaproteobacteria bacterium]
MPVFEYKGFSSKGKTIKGIIEADSQRAARIKLKESGIYATDFKQEIEHASETASQSSISDLLTRIKQQEVAIATRQLASLLSAGLTLIDSIEALVEQMDNIKLKKVLSNVKSKINEGSSLADALKVAPKVFPEFYINMVAAGESSGALDIVLQRLADYIENQVKLKYKIIATMVYPAIMVSLATIVVIALMTFVIPKVSMLFRDVHQTLPLFTRVLIFISNTLNSYWYLFLLMLIGIFYIVRWYIRTDRGKRKFESMLFNMPVFGKLIRMTIVARFARTLSTLLKSGVPVVKAMDIVKTIVNNTIIEEAIEKAKVAIVEGSTIAAPLKASGVFPPMVTRMITVGEQSGELEGMLEKVASTYEDNVTTAVSALTALLEPILILMMASIVLFIILSVLVPIFEMNQLVH